jgi:Zn-dependent peptidase ImmA (M78 family)
MLNITTTKVGPLTYNVLLVTDRTNKDFFNEDGTLRMYGECNYINQTICINKYISDEKLRITLIHELTHAYIDTMYRGVLVSRDDSFNEEEVAHFFGMYGSIIVAEANRLFIEILNGRRDDSYGMQEKD